MGLVDKAEKEVHEETKDAFDGHQENLNYIIDMVLMAMDDFDDAYKKELGLTVFIKETKGVVSIPHTTLSVSYNARRPAASN
jgi:hypothetical protein